MIGRIGGLLGALIGGVAALRFVTQRALPRPGLIRIAGLDGEVEILRDRWGVPHIYAQSEHDLFYANGVVHAEERLWQMELNRRAATGRLSEVFGSATLGIDRFIRRVGLHRSAQADLERLDAPTLRMLRAYVAGVNWVIESRPRPVEFLLTRHRPGPWTEVDSLAWAKLMAWTLSVNWESELTRLKIINRVGLDLAAELEPVYPDGAWISAHGEDVARVASSVETSFAELLTVTGLGGIGGSNGWAVAPSRSATGSAILANDMHLAPQMPSIWYVLGLEGPDSPSERGIRVIGSSLPGLPGIVVGHNRDIAWGYTASLADVQDLFVERPHPDDPTRFARGDGWETATTIVEEIRVRGEPRWRREEVLVTSNGPIISPLIEGVDITLALRAAPLEPAATLTAGMTLLRARNWNEFRDALREWATPSLGVVYADTSGNIGYQTVGLLPVRTAGDGTLPRPGWDSAYAWKGFIPFDELPMRFNPPEGYVATANNQPMPDDYPHPLGSDWCDAYRIGRIVECLRSRDHHSVASMRELQLDTMSTAARSIVAACAEILGAEVPLDPLEREAWRRFRHWDGDIARSSPDAAMYELFRGKLLRLLYSRRLGDLTDMYLGAPPHGNVGGTSFAWRASSRLIRGLGDPTFPEKLGHRGFSWRDLILIAFGEAIAILRGSQGEEIADWRWGKIHQLSFEHPLARIGILRRWLNRGPFPIGGDTDTPLQIGASAYAPDGKVGWAPSYRQIVDLGDLPSAMGMHTTGQSGQPGSRHYADLIPMWLSGDYFALLWNRADVEAHLSEETRLLPTDEDWPRS
ncbi:MAG: penicillin acylase family protein [Chloroflexota bacterium]|nr:MAG: penicillin acylase family protein [Chloroflexota bacterium]